MGREGILKGDYLEVYNVIVDEIETEEISYIFTKEVKDDIFSMLASAQESGVAPSEIVSNNPKEFVEEIVTDFHKANSGIFKIGRLISSFLIAIAAISFTVIRGVRLNFTVDIIILGLIYIFIEEFARKISKKKKIGYSTRNGSKHMFDVALIVVISVIFGMITENINFKTLFVVDSPFIFIFSLIGISGIIHAILEKKYS